MHGFSSAVLSLWKRQTFVRRRWILLWSWIFLEHFHFVHSHTTTQRTDKRAQLKWAKGREEKKYKAHITFRTHCNIKRITQIKEILFDFEREKHRFDHFAELIEHTETKKHKWIHVNQILRIKENRTKVLDFIERRKNSKLREESVFRLCKFYSVAYSMRI